MIKIVPNINMEKEFPSLWRMTKYADYWLFKNIKEHLIEYNKRSELVDGLAMDMPYFWIAGGFLRDFFTDDEVSDIDLFFSNEGSLETLFKIIKSCYPNAIVTFQNDKVFKIVVEAKNRKIKLDLIKYYFADPVQCIEAFDFTIAMLAVDITGNVYYDERAPFDIAKKRLVVNNIRYPISTLQRFYKFVKRGYVACNGTMLEIAKSMKDVDFEDKNQNPIEFYTDGELRIFGYD